MQTIIIMIYHSWKKLAHIAVLRLTVLKLQMAYLPIINNNNQMSTN